MRRLAPALALIAVLGGSLAFQAAAIGRTGFVWDELVMLREAAEHGRPHSRFADGVTLAHAPLFSLAKTCRDPTRTLLSARTLWLVFSALLLGALSLLLVAVGRAAGDGDGAWIGGLVALAMLALAPMFQRWALQVRIDQPALAAALVGGVALLYSRRVLPLALVAGALFGAAICCSPRAASTIGLSLLLVGVERRLASRRGAAGCSAHHARRTLALLVVGAAAVIIVVATSMAGGVHALSLSRPSGIDLLFSGDLRPRSYQMLWPPLLPHLLAIVIIAVGVLWRRALRRDARTSACLGALLIAALDVAIFGLAPHSSWLYYGSALAAAVALGLAPLARALPLRRRALLGVGVAAVLLIPAVPGAMALLIDTQKYQRATYRFVERLAGRGYHPDGGLACHQVARLPILDRAAVERHFADASDERDAAERFLAQLRRSGARFVLASYQLGGMPRPLRYALAKRFIRMRGTVLLPGLHLHNVDDSKTFVAYISGHYRFELIKNHRPLSIWIDGQQLWSGDTMWLPAGPHKLEVYHQPILGSLVLDLYVRYKPGRFKFYEQTALGEHAGDAWRGARLPR